MLTGCFGSSSNSGTTDPVIPSKPTPNFSYYFGAGNELQVYSFDHESEEKKLIMTGPKEITFATQAGLNGLSTLGDLFLLKDGIWKYVTSKDNTVKVIAEASNISEICDATALTGAETTYLYYATPGADEDCSEEADNLSYRIDTSMEADAAALVINNELFLAGERQGVITNDVAKGFLVKKNFGLDTLLYANLDFTSTLTLENNVPGYIRIDEFSNHNSIILKFDNKLYDVTAEQLEAGNIGEAFFTNANVKTYTSRNQLYYSEGKKLYQYDLSKKQSTLIHELVTGSVGDLEINSKGVLVHVGTGSPDFLHITTDDLNAITVTNVTLEAATRSSNTNSIVGGFIHSIKNVDGSQKAFYVSDTGSVTEIENAEWAKIRANTLDAGSAPILLTYGETTNTLSKWSTDTKAIEFEYGQLSKEATGLRADSNMSSDTLLISLLSDNDDVKGLLYTLDISKADSLKPLGNGPGFTVAY